MRQLINSSPHVLKVLFGFSTGIDSSKARSSSKRVVVVPALIPLKPVDMFNVVGIVQ